MFPKKGLDSYGQKPPYGAQQPFGQISGNGGGYATSVSAAGGADGARFAGHAAQGSAGQYGGPYASVYGAQPVGGLAGKGPGSSGFSSLQTHPKPLSESSKLLSGTVGPNLGRPNDDYLASRGYAQKLDQYSADYALERRMHSEHSANLGRRDALTDLDRRYPNHIPGNHQIHDPVEQVRHQQLLKPQRQPGSDIRQADYFAGRSGPVHQESHEIGAYGRVEVDHRNLSVLDSVPYGGQQPAASLLGGASRANIDSTVYGQGSSSRVYGLSLPTGHDYTSGKGSLHASSGYDHRDSILSRVYPGISMVDERTGDRGGYRREQDLRDDGHQRELFWEREKEHEREREWGRERERERDLRERERDRECRDIEMERERRERERERAHLRERREKERERDRKQGADPRRELISPRTPHARRRSPSVRSEKPLRRLSPRRNAVHRHRSPVKQIKREYICKVHPFCLADAERDYLSLTKRYPRLAITPDCSKVVLNWPKENLNLSLHTPVSLEHDIHQMDDKFDEKRALSSEKSYCANTSDTTWNAKVLLMSGMSNSAFADICSPASAEERIVHLNSILKFAVFKKDHALVAIGGPWNAAIDGGDPLVDRSCLIRTAIRYAKELVQVDLSNCTHWNHFLEVHYSRVGQDGLFSHKEITLLFVPNLSECLPSVDVWKNNWIAYRKSIAEKEQLTIKKEKSPGDAKEHKQGDLSQGKTTNDSHLMEGDICHNAIKTEEVNINMDHKDKVEETCLAENNAEEIQNVEEHVEKGKDVQENASGASIDHAIKVKKPTKRKIIKKVIKKVVRKKPVAGALAGKSSLGDKIVVAETGRRTVEEQVEQTTEDVGKEQDGTGINQDHETKKSGKKKVIRRVVKRKLSALGSKLSTPAVLAESSKQEADVQPEKNDKNLTVAGNSGNSHSKLAEGLKTPADEITNQNIDGTEKGITLTEVQKSNGDKVSEQEVLKQKGAEKDERNENKDKTKDDKEKRSRDSKKDLKKKTLIDSKDRKKPDMPPRHSGFILQAKRSKESKLRSISLSLDGLLDYTTNDIEESGFELSLFAESFCEMLQYRMGCVILSFLEKLHKHYVVKKNQRKKRTREEDVKKESERSSEKRPKTTEETVTESTHNNNNTGKNVEIIKEGEEDMSIDHLAAAHEPHDAHEVDEKIEEESECEEDPEEVEIYEDVDEDLDDATAEEQTAGKLNNTEAKPEEAAGEDNRNKNKEEELELANSASSHGKSASGEEKQSVAEKGSLVEKTVSKEKIAVSQKGDAGKDEAVDKELLQAFRYFDQNRVGYIKVEDLRCILQNLGKFLSNRDVKDLAQTALAESNSRDNRVPYAKLVKIVDV